MLHTRTCAKVSGSRGLDLGDSICSVAELTDAEEPIEVL